MAVVIIVIILVVALLGLSIYGIFLSSEDTGNGNIKMSDCVSELNSEMNNQINYIKSTNEHDEVIIHSNRAEWKEILSIYSVSFLNHNNQNEVLTIDQSKKDFLRKVFWEMNSITFEVIEEDFDDSSSIGSLGRDDYDNEDDESTNESHLKKVLHIYINSTPVEDMRQKYGFNDLQMKQYKELTDTKYNYLWNSVIYGSSFNSGEIADWKQKGKPWSNIKIGTTDSTIGDIGCLVTSIAILIKKSGTSTPNISPFNPGTFVQALNDKYGFDSHGNLMYSSIQKVVPNFKYGGRVGLRKQNQSEKLQTIKSYFDKGYYLAIEVKGATKNSQHWVALDYIDNNTIKMLDPASDSIDMWSKYDWSKTSQFVFFKV